MEGHSGGGLVIEVQHWHVSRFIVGVFSAHARPFQDELCFVSPDSSFNVALLIYAENVGSMASDKEASPMISGLSKGIVRR